ncbi:aldo/keto reductase [Ahrensia sp. R2A130]|uniref:aldo/keto reductase n=1 Tax=Ahrensia sp. R2A130 TaxID=744979 RepID=UPI0001E0D0B7|nr:aldo/keto reductase [Ahrensia sp. R2A130]EFL90856.1 putative aryl-alcohol dehydrogenase C977.14c [Ahrensia sp. R2A130]
MEYVQLGRTGTQVSKLCLGCMSFGTPGGPTHPWVIPEADGEPFFKLAVESGINFFDTADHYNYGDSEEITGRMLKKFARRDEIVVATKVGLTMGEGPNKRGLSRKRIIEGVDASLKRLQMDHVDLLYVHRLDPDTPDEEMLEALDHVVRAGKVIYPAASSMYAWQFAKLREMQKAAGYTPFVAMQNLLNLAYREEEREMLPYCEAEGVAVVPWSPIARGFLAGNKPKEGEGTNRAKIDKAGHLFGAKQDYAILERVQAVAEQIGTSPAQVAYAWVLQHPNVTAPIVGATKLHQLEEAIAACDVKLTAAQIKRLETPYKPRAVMGHQ